VAPDADYGTDVDALLALVTDGRAWSSWPTPTTPPAASCPRAIWPGCTRLPSDVLLVIDQAYAEYVAPQDEDGALALAEARQCAGHAHLFQDLRPCGRTRRLGHRPAPLVDALNRIRGPFNLSNTAQAMGLAAVADQALWRPAHAQPPRAPLCRAVERAGHHGIRPLPSEANFVLILFEGRLSAEPVYNGLMEVAISPAGCPVRACRMRCASPSARSADGRDRRRHRPHGNAAHERGAFCHVAIIGLGLLGGSIGLALASICRHRTTGYDRNPTPAPARPNAAWWTRWRHRGRGGGRRRSGDLLRAAAGHGRCRARMRRRCAPMRWSPMSAPARSPWARRWPRRWAKPPTRIIPAHPVAGTENSGPDGLASLFKGRWCIITPPRGPRRSPASPPSGRRIGARVEIMDAAHHDRVLAVTSHLPHLIAYTIVGTAATGRSDPERGHQIFGRRLPRFHPHRRQRPHHVARRVPVQPRRRAGNAAGFTEDLTALQRAIRVGDGEQLFDHFARTRAIRRSIIEQGQDVAQANFGRDAS
jgi:prephenate dehydrogenase